MIRTLSSVFRTEDEGRSSERFLLHHFSGGL